MSASRGLHHVTAIAGPAARNRLFYTGTLGLRLVKRTVNFDDPGTHHLYYGDAAGAPGTVLTFFPWRQTGAGRAGTGEAVETAFRVPEGAIGWWLHRFAAAGVAFETPRAVFGATTLPFSDPDGTRLALVAVPGLAAEPGWTGGGVAEAHAIRGLAGVTLAVPAVAPTAAILTGVLGFTATGHDGGDLRLSCAARAGGSVTLRATGAGAPGRPGGGTVHHVAFRAADDADQAAMVARLRAEHGLVATEQRNRQYFRSVYVREPGGVLFEIATDGPGFAVDEPADALGEALRLPPGLEGRLGEIEASLPSLEDGPGA